MARLAATIACLLAASCGQGAPARANAAGPGRAVVVQGLVLEARDLSRPDDQGLVVRAEHAVFDDLPGRGAGQLEGATVSVGEGVTLRARTARLEPDGGLVAEGVRATLRPLAPEARP